MAATLVQPPLAAFLEHLTLDNRTSLVPNRSETTITVAGLEVEARASIPVPNAVNYVATRRHSIERQCSSDRDTCNQNLNIKTGMQAQASYRSPDKGPAYQTDERKAIAELSRAAKNDSKLFKIVHVADKGSGLIAQQAISQDTIVHSEQPLLTCPVTTSAANASVIELLLSQKVQILSSSDRKFFLHALTNAFPSKKTPLTGKIRTNSLPCGRRGTHGAIFRVLSIANHSCAPNAEYYWDSKTAKGELYALKDIAAGEEICISYIDMAPHKSRQVKLQQCFGFVCRCSLCSMSKKRRREEDCRIREIEVVESALYSDPRALRDDLDGAFSRFQRLAVLYAQSERDCSKDLDRLWAALADLCVANLEPDDAVGRLMTLTNIEEEAAVVVVSTWYTEYEDQV